MEKFLLKKQPDSFNSFSRIFINEIDSFIKKYYKGRVKSSDIPFITEMYNMLEEYCTRPGKRIRPLVLLAAFSGYKKSPGNYSEIIKLASAIEIMHSFLLIQDDIIDESSLRRGGKALHISAGDKYSGFTYNNSIGSDIAIVLADVLMSNALEIVNDAGIRPEVKNRFLEVFSRTYEMTAWGQILDILHSHPRKTEFHQDIPMQIISMKTAHYTFYYPMLMGYLLSGKNDDDEKKKIMKFALPIGSAFQVRDDINGVFGKVEETGKSNDSDITEGKMTILVQKTIERLKGKKKSEFKTAFSAPKKKKADISFIRDAIIDSGALDESFEIHKRLINEAEENLRYLSLKENYRQVFNGMIEKLKGIKDF